MVSLPNRLVFGAFQAEAWGRVGSRRFASEMKSFVCEKNVSADVALEGYDFCQMPVRTNLAFTKLVPAGVRHVVGVDQVRRRRLLPSYLY